MIENNENVSNNSLERERERERELVLTSLIIIQKKFI
jgi:hypothetical protein